VSWKRICNGLLGPDIPVHLRDDFTLLTARHMRGQARLLFVGFILSLPMVVLGASPGAGRLVAYGLPAAIFVLCALALASVARPLAPSATAEEARKTIDTLWQLCLLAAALGSLWCVASWASAPVEVRLYYPAIMSLGALMLSYCLMAVRSVAMSVLLVTLGPVACVLAGTGATMDRVLAVSILIAVGFQMVMMVRHQQLLVSLVEERHKSGELARRDPLTGLANRRALIEQFEGFADSGASLRLMVIDIDRFKRINDRFGHDMGDRVLQTIATVLLSHARGDICAARLGGEEFAMLSRSDALDPALALQLLREIRTSEMPHGEAVTASIGVADAVVTQAEDWTALYGQADRALYRAKDEGRDRVEAFKKDAAAQARTPSRPARQA
jgi:diguanylate cyclase (GGDEF)-like protein